MRAYLSWMYGRLVETANATRTQSSFSSSGKWIYVFLTCWSAFTLAGIAMGGFRFGSSGYYSLFFFGLYLFATALLARRYSLNNSALFLEASSLPILIGSVGASTTVVLTPISLPFADETYIYLDAMLGFSWIEMFNLYMKYPETFSISRYIYFSFALQSMAVPIVLVLLNQAGRFWAYMHAWLISSALVAFLYPLAPGYGPYPLFGIKRSDIPGDMPESPWIYGEVIAGLKDGSIRNLGDAMFGLVSFPSFHAAAAILFAWATWQSQWLRWPMLALNMAMLVSTIVTGGHYLVDLIGGVGVAAIAIVASNRIVRSRDRFQRPMSELGLAPA